MKSTGWRAFSIQEIASTERYALNCGPFGSKLVSNMYVANGVPVIRGTNLPFDRKFSYRDFVYVTAERAEELRPNQARPGDLIFTQRGTLGQIGLIPLDAPDKKFLVSQSQMKLSVDRSKANPLFVYYYFRQPRVVEKIESYALRSGVPHINLQILREFPIELPDVASQERIAAILSSYDDLIENNTRRIAILEEMARRIFEEWFVHFRAPGCESLPRIETSLGPVPKGWEVGPVNRTYEGLFDGPHATPAPSTTGPVFLGIQNIREAGGFDLSTIRHINELDFEKWTKRVTPQKDDIVFSYEATLNRYALVPGGVRCCLGRRMALIRPNRDYRLFLYLCFFSKTWRRVVTENTLSGATVDRIPLTRFPTFPIILPPQTLVAEFERLLTPTFNSIEVLRAMNSNLRAQRDLLLPKLISGEINVSEAPAILEAAE